MRALIRTSLTTDPELLALGVVPDGVFSGDVDTPKQRPFLQLRWSTTTPGLAAVSRRILVIWIHDLPGDYARVDAIIRRIRVILGALAGQPHPAGHVVACEWTGDSEDLTDPAHGTITRTTSYSLVGTGQ